MKATRLSESTGIRRLYLFGDVTDDNAKQLIEEIEQSAEDSEDISLYLNTAGGSVSAAYAIHDILRGYPGTVEITALGRVHSAGITILLGADKERRYSYPNTEFMTHDVSWKADGVRHVMRERTGQLEYTVRRLAELYAKRTGLAIGEVNRFFDDGRDHYFSASKALRYGFISKIVGA